MIEETHILRKEIMLMLGTSKDIDEFNVSYAVPPIYKEQVPLFVEIKNDPAKF